MVDWSSRAISMPETDLDRGTSDCKYVTETQLHVSLTWNKIYLLQTSFGHVSINSSMIPTVSMATESP